MKSDWPRAAVAAFAILLLSSCSQINRPTQPNSQTPEGMSQITPAKTGEASETENQEPTKDGVLMNQSPEPTFTSDLEYLTDKAKEDLVQRLSIEKTQIELIEARGVVWPNASLGCPQPGMAYADVLTPGYLILLEANNVEYEYHASKGTEVFYCENPTPPVQGTPIDV